MTPLLALHTVVTLMLLGLIWTVQLAIYPLFAAIGDGAGHGAFARYHAAYLRRITRLVAPLMGVELLSGALLVARVPAGVPPTAAIAGAALIGLVWASTALVQVPLHARVCGARAEPERQRLARSNWIRTAAWSARGALVVWMCAAAIGGAA